MSTVKFKKASYLALIVFALWGALCVYALIKAANEVAAAQSKVAIYHGGYK